MPFGPGTGWVPALGSASAVAIAYFFAAHLGLALRVQAGVAAFWPAAGIAVGALIAWGRNARAPVAAAAIVATTLANIEIGRNLWLAAVFGLINAGHGLLTAWLIERTFGSAFKLESVPQVLGLLVASAIGAAAAAACSAVAVSIVEPAAPVLNVWRLWFASCLLGTVTVAPLLIGIGEALRDPPPPRELLQGAVSLVGLAAQSVFVLSLRPAFWRTALPVAIVFPLLLWIVVRCRPVFAAAAAFVAAVAVIGSTTFSTGHFGDLAVPLSDRVLAAQTVVLVTALLTLILAALFAERRRSEAALSESDTRLRSILDAAAVIAWDVDLIRDSVHSAGPVARLLGHLQHAGSHTLSALFGMIHPEDRDRVTTEFWTALNMAASYRLEFRLKLPGDVRWITAEGSVERDIDGRPVRVRGITRDITERKNMELALVERTTQLALAEKSALVGSFAYDVDAEKLQMSDGYAAIHGFPNDTGEIPRSEWQVGVHPEDRVQLDELRSRAFRTRSPEYTVEFRIVRSGREVRWIEGRAFVGYRADGSPQRVVGVNIDVTERKRAEEQLRALNAELDHRVKNVLATVSAVAAHTLDPSSSVKDYVDALHGRLKSMASAHELLSDGAWRGIPLAELLRRELAPYANGDNTQLIGPDVILSAEAGQSVAMVLHELTTNAAKYGALSRREGRVSARWHWSATGNPVDQLIIEWQETGGPPIAVSCKAGYGTRVIRELVPYELGGTAEFTLAFEGVRCRLNIPAKWVSTTTGRTSVNR